MTCSVDMSHAGATLNPLSLFTLLTSITTHTHVHPLLFRQPGFDYEFSLDFRPSLAVFTPEELVNRTKHPSSFCHFQGANQHGIRGWLSVCDLDDIEMALHAPLAVFTLDHDNGTFLLVSEDERDGCDALWKHSNKRGVSRKPSKIPHDQSLPAYYANFAHLFTRRRYIEFAMFGDYSLLYDSLNIELRLVKLVIFKAPQIPESIFGTNRNKFLAYFGKYLKKKYNGEHYDTASLMIANHMKINGSNETGVARKFSICSPEYAFNSISFIRDLSKREKRRQSVRVVATLAHELGHVLGMNHDHQHDFLDCECPAEKGCVMHSVGGDYKQYWSNCSLAYLDWMYRTGADYCMWDEPKSAGPSICGNGIVENGEDCDYGQLGCVTHNCCDLTTCKFSKNATCATGLCCDLSSCSILGSDNVCRDTATSCDLPEYCDGLSNECPDNKHRNDGEPCPDDENAICFGGRCPNRTVQCEEIWGEQAISAGDEKCYESNLKRFGCGKESESLGRKCKNKDKLCGRLYCALPEGKYNTTRGWWKPEQSCTSMLANYQERFKPDHHFGMTLDGTSCGEGKYCLKSKCVHKMELLGCKLDHLLDKTHCEDDNECVKPNQTDAKDLYCDSDFGLQAELADRQWVDVASVACKKGRFKVISKKRLKLVSVIGFRCVRKKISKFFDADDCESNEDCMMPRNCTSMQCDPQWELQAKTESTPWSQIQSIRCDSDKFVVDGSSETANRLLKIRCVRLKCSACENPCPSCKINSISSFKQSNKWNECAEFSCPADTHTAIEHGYTGERIQNIKAQLECLSSGPETSVWKVNESYSIEAKKHGVTCEKLCTIHSPLISECRKDDARCELWKPDNDHPASCKNGMYYVSKASLPIEIVNLHCNKHDGSWTIDRNDNGINLIVPSGSNVYCYDGDCDGSIIFPECEPKDKCDEYAATGNKFNCNDSSKLWSRESEDKPWVEMENIHELECLAGYIIANGTRMSHGFQASCRKIDTTQTTSEREGISIYVIIGCSFLLLLIIAIIVIVALRIAGRGWIHTKIIAKIRGQKISITYSISSSKTNTPSRTPRAVSTRKE